MKNNLLFVAIIAICCSACAGVRSRPPTPFKMSDEVKTQSEKEEMYGRYHVEKAEGLTSLIGEKHYSSLATERYFSNSDSKDSAEIIQQSIDIKRTGTKVEIGSLIGGTVLVGGAGFVIGLTSLPQGYGYGSLGGGYDLIAYAAVGVVVGAIIGEATGWSINHWHYEPKSEEKFGEATSSFNQYLRQQLKLEIAPTAGGASGAVKLTY